MTYTEPFVDTATTIRSHVDDAAAGKDHTVILSNGSITCLGSNRRGQLGLPSSDRRTEHTVSFPPSTTILSVHATWSASFAVVKVEKEYALWMWGSLGTLRPDAPTQLRRIALPPMRKPPVVACGSEHVLVIVNDAEVWTFGWNESVCRQGSDLTYADTAISVSDISTIRTILSSSIWEESRSAWQLATRRAGLHSSDERCRTVKLLQVEEQA